MRKLSTEEMLILLKEILYPTLVFVLELIRLSLILRKAKAAYEFSESEEKMIHVLFMDDLKLYSRSEKGLE